MSFNRGLYAYGLIGELPPLLDILGIDGKNSVYAVQERELCVLVSEIDIDAFQGQTKQLFSALTIASPQAAFGDGESILHIHENVVDTLMKRTTIVPFQFGTILKDEVAASKMLRDDEEQFKKLLARFAGKEEWGLKVYTDQQVCTQYLVQIEPRFKDVEGQPEHSARGTAYLVRRKTEIALKDYAVTWLAGIADQIFQDLAHIACEAKIQKTQPQKWTGKSKEMILNAVYLLGVEHTVGMYERVEVLKERYKVVGLELELSGPWPPYSFIKQDVG